MVLELELAWRNSVQLAVFSLAGKKQKKELIKQGHEYLNI